MTQNELNQIEELIERQGFYAFSEVIPNRANVETPLIQRTVVMQYML